MNYDGRLYITNWLLISEIHSVFNTLKRDCNWDLDEFEISKLVKSVYNSIYSSQGYFHYIDSKEYFTTILEKSRIDCWGHGNECKNLTDKEINIFHSNLSVMVANHLNGRSVQ